MRIVSSIINKLAQKHASKMSKIVNRQYDPQLYDAIMDRTSMFLNKLGVNNVRSVNCEMDLCENMFFETLGLDGISLFYDVLKYGKYATDYTRVKLSEYSHEYLECLKANMPPLKGRGFILDMRKTDYVPEEEIRNTLKSIYGFA